MPPLSIKAPIVEIVSEIANELAMVAYRKQYFVGFQPEESIGEWVDEMTEWIVIVIEMFREDNSDVEDALDEIRALVCRLFEHQSRLPRRFPDKETN